MELPQRQTIGINFNNVLQWKKVGNTVHVTYRITGPNGFPYTIKYDGQEGEMVYAELLEMDAIQRDIGECSQ